MWFVCGWCDEKPWICQSPSEKRDILRRCHTEAEAIAFLPFAIKRWEKRMEAGGGGVDVPDKTIRLTFDPIQEFGVMWLDDEARVLWLLWRPGHLVPQGFERHCLAVAKTIREDNPQTVEDLARCFPAMSETFSRHDVNQFAPDALPYFTGEKLIDWEYVPR